jgi:hypothetical protein
MLNFVSAYCWVLRVFNQKGCYFILIYIKSIFF